MARSDYDQAILDEITAISNSLERIANAGDQRLLNEQHSPLVRIADALEDLVRLEANHPSRT